MPYVSIKTFPQDEDARRRAAEKIQRLLMEEWGSEADWISVSIENIEPERWDERIVRGAMEDDAPYMLIRDGERLYD
ncbi:MAG: hypothetical protein IKD79_04680 [Oscillospiraceae bacterium]|nr:hypothetical protein [Oscillospiraceae bacterium]